MWSEPCQELVLLLYRVDQETVRREMPEDNTRTRRSHATRHVFEKMEEWDKKHKQKHRVNHNPEAEKALQQPDASAPDVSRKASAAPTASSIDTRPVAHAYSGCGGGGGANGGQVACSSTDARRRSQARPTRSQRGPALC